ncbi:cms1 ribosomal small subunit [Porites harrisoni]
MADDLDDEWWLENDIENKEETKGKKRRRKVTDRTDLRTRDDQLDDDSMNSKGAAKKRRKKPKIKSVTSELEGKEAADILWTTFCESTAGSLSTLELEDIMIDSSCCLLDDSTHSGALGEVVPYLSKVIPHWSGNVAKLDRKGNKGAPILLFVSSAATRAVDLNRSAAEFKGNCKTVKLFAKHMKMSEQESFLESHVVHFGIGTPSRILKLLQNGALKTLRLKYVILDWTWRDQKLRRMIDIPEVRGEVINLLKDFVFPLAKASKLKIGLL